MRHGGLGGDMHGMVGLGTPSASHAHASRGHGTRTSLVRIFSVVFVLVMAAGAGVRAGEVDFNRDIRPILAENCLSCHGQDASSRSAGLRLDEFEAATGTLKSGLRAIVPGDRGASAVMARVSSQDDDVRMPPVKTGKRLTAEQIETLGRWIDAGADYATHWAFTRVDRPGVPELGAEDAKRARNAVDAFILAKLRERGLTPSPEADRRTLIRRLSFDLHGLPPDPARVEAFVGDEASDAYERLVEELLASPRYGERWARHWLDLAHYADTHGYDKDQLRRNAWPYRDYVIRALNEDKPYGRFVEEQVAGDVLYRGEPDGIVALGFIAAGPWDLVGHAELGEEQPDKKIVRNLDRDDMVATVMNAFSSMTVQCARCHDHKFDPISQEDYYSLQAVFAAVDRADRAFDADPAVMKRRGELESQLDDARARMKELDARIREQGGEALAAVERELAELRQQREGQHPAFGYHSQLESSADQTKWVQVDLGRAVALDRVVLIGAHDTFNGIGAGFGFPVRFRVEGSNDGAFGRGVVMLADHTGEDLGNPGVEPVVVAGGDRPVRYVRVTATKLAQRLASDYIFALGELEAIDGEGKNVARGAKVSAYDTIEAPVRWGMGNLVDGVYYGASGDELEARIAAREMKWDEVLKQRVDGGLLSAREELFGAIEEVEAALGELPRRQLVYAAATRFSPMGNFHPTNGEAREVFLLNRGDEKQPVRAVGPGTLGVIDGLGSRFEQSGNEDEGARRAALARWLTDRDNGLTWRSIVNRVWQHHFGRAIVETANDFGLMGATPTHPELLDYLAATFRDGDQSLKGLHRVIVTSATYRQVSTGDGGNEAIDAGNLYLWRMNRRKLEAEAVRDAVLSSAGKLDLRMGGPGFFAFGFVEDHSPHYKYQEHDPDDPASHRRSVYRFVVRSVPDPFMETLDCADPSQVVAKRLETMTALQALALMNNPFMVRMAEHFAARLEVMAGTLEGRIEAAYLLALGREPTEEEMRALAELAKEHGLANVARLIFNMNEFVFVD